MKTISLSFCLSVLLISSSIAFAAEAAYDESLMINVHKVNNLLKHAESVGRTLSGEICQVEIRRIEDGYYTVFAQGEGNEIFVGLDIESYGKIQSHFTKHSAVVSQVGVDGSQKLVMKENDSTRHLVVQAEDDESGCFSSKHHQLTCYLPLK